jgi:Prion-inhibition and propagation
MASFGEAAAAISVTVELFNLCVEGLHAISRAKHSHKSLIDFTTRLDLEIARLVLWGRNAGLDRSKLDPSLEPVQPLLAKILGAVASSIQSAGQLKATYGLDLVDTEGGNSPSPQSSSSPSLAKLDILSLPQISSAIQRQQLLSLKLKKHTSIYKKTKWAILDGEKAIGFVDAIKGYVDGLNKLLTESQKAALDAETTALRIAILGTDWSQPVKMLSTIENATMGRYESLALPARLARLRLELEIEEIAPSLSEAGRLPASPLPIQYDQLQSLGMDRSVAVFHNMNVLVEWRNLTASEASGETGRARAKQAAGLASIFQELKSQPAEYRVLGCVGYVDQRDHRPPRLGTVFNMPQVPQTSTTKKLFHSLYEYLSSPDFEDFQPALGQRFELARKLTRGFLQFHQLGWLHKNIRSHNIIFFPESETALIESPFILGFAFSRPYEAGISDPVAVAEELELYQHREYQGKTGKGYNLRYDLFSIGLLLFEIAKWRSLKNYFTRLRKHDAEVDTKTFATKLVEEEKEELKFRMGEHYTTAVMACLEGQFGVEGDDRNDTSLKLAYFDKVVKTLALCRA